MLEHRDALLALVPHHPRTAVEVQENRRCDRPFKSRLAIDVEAMGVDRVVGVSDVAEPFDASWPDRQGQDDAAGVLRAPIPPRYDLARLDKCRLEVPTRPQAGGELCHEARARYRGQRKAHPARPAPEAAP